MPTRQKREDIERKPKTVHYSTSWSDPAGLMKDPAKAKAVLAAIRAIEGGAPLLTGYYRKGIGTTSDTLLASLGVMHLHLGKPNTDELLYLVQYPDDVLLLELSDHTHFKSTPIGRRLDAQHSKAIADKEAELEALLLARKRKIVLPPRKTPAPAPVQEGEEKADPSGEAPSAV